MNIKDKLIITHYLNREPFDLDEWTPAETREWVSYIKKMTRETNTEP